MLAEINAFFLPTMLDPSDLGGGIAIVIDLLRASSTISQALAAGAKDIIPCLEVDEARARTAALAATGSRTLLGGEREGVRIEGFDLGNSPSEYQPEVVRGRTIVFTTTNGTRAMNSCRSASRVLIGSFVNLTAVCEAVAQFGGSCHLVCAGTKGKITREDVLCAGAIVDRLVASGAVDESKQNDQARIARESWRNAMGAAMGDLTKARLALAETLRDTQGGRNLIRLGLERDIVDCAELDALDVVPELDLVAWRISARST